MLRIRAIQNAYPVRSCSDPTVVGWRSGTGEVHHKDCCPRAAQPFHFSPENIWVGQMMQHVFREHGAEVMLRQLQSGQPSVVEGDS